ncbi:hypothetical protein B6U93_02955 [Candidatus Woesearchaeota archaeon ex4484_78]|nr:MAG: hypothetical protein B6U93_02955 [Candidatus Woesearchaeota archaeon ex4484_78]
MSKTNSKRTLCLSDKFVNPNFFDSLKDKIGIVCVGDSITGWNPERFEFWPFLTYPSFLQELLPDYKIVNCGIAGEFSKNGISLVENCLKLFPNAKFFIVGFGTNDLALGLLTETSKKIINNLKIMIDLVIKAGKIPFLINVPYLKESVFEKKRAEIAHDKRDYHNQKLAEAFSGKVKIIDICSKLKDEHFGDSLHPNKKGAEIIAKEVFKVLNLK